MTTSLVVAIEPDRQQAARLSAVVHARLGAELVLADSVARALTALGDRVPDLILTPPLMSTRDEAALSSRLRELGAAAAHVQTVTVPRIGGAPAGTAEGGMFRRFRRSRPAPAAADGCDPDVFAQQVSDYLQRAVAERVSVMAPPIAVAAAPPIQAAAAEEAIAPAPAAPPVTAPPPVIEEEAAPIPVEALEPIPVFEEWMTATAAPVLEQVIVRTEIEDMPAPAVPAVEEVAAPVMAAAEIADAPVMGVEEVAAQPAVAIEELPRTPVLMAVEIISPAAVVVEEVAAPPVMMVEDIAAPSVVALEDIAPPPVIAVDEMAAVPVIAVEDIAADPPVMVVEEVTAPPLVVREEIPTTPVMMVEEIVTAPVMMVEEIVIPPVIAAEQFVTPPVMAVDDSAVLPVMGEEPVAATAPIQEIDQPAIASEVLGPLAAAPAEEELRFSVEDLELAMWVADEPEAAPSETSDVPPAVAEDDHFYIAAQDYGDVDILTLLDGLVLPDATVIESEPPVAETVASPPAAPPEPQPEPEHDLVPAPLPARRKLPPRRPLPAQDRGAEPKAARRRTPAVQDEWGLFDPDQCGFAALLATLDAVTEDEEMSKRRGTQTRVISYN